MRIIGIVVVRNEADVIGLSIQHHLALGLDRVLVLDNGSSDGTIDILKRLSRVDRRVHWKSSTAKFEQVSLRTGLARDAFRQGADWIVPFDADEFLWVRGGDLRALLAASTAGALVAEVVNFVQDRACLYPSEDGLLTMTRRSTARGSDEQVKTKQIGYVELHYSPKILSRPTSEILIGPGNHAVLGAAGPTVWEPDLAVLHAPLRSRDCLMRKADHGERTLQAGSTPENSWHLKRWARLRAEGELEGEWAANSYVGTSLDVYGEKRRLIMDDRLREAVSPFVKERKKASRGKDKARETVRASKSRDVAMTYLEALQDLHDMLQPDVRLEPGTTNGCSLKCSQSRSIVVNPSVAVNDVDLTERPWGTLYRTSSRAFPRNHDRETALEGGWLGLAVLDGERHFERLLRNLIDVERCSTRDTVIVIPGVIPPDVQSAGRDEPSRGAWVGDIWKIVLCLAQYRPDLTIDVVDASPAGLLIIQNPDPDNTVLGQRYATIVEEYVSPVANKDSRVAVYLENLVPVATRDFLAEMRTERMRGVGGRKSLNVIEATYGRGNEVVDVTATLQDLVRNGRLFLKVSNTYFSDPCAGKLKTLAVTYELAGHDRQYHHAVDEHRILALPVSFRESIGILYTNSSFPPVYLGRVLGQLEKATTVDILTCPWRPIPGNPFVELNWPIHVSSHLTIALQILKLLHTAQQIGNYEYVFFLEHDVLYPEGYFDIEPFTEDVLCNTNYIGLSEAGFQPERAGQDPLHQLVMRLPVAIEHFTALIPTLLTRGSAPLEPFGRSWKTRQSAEPAVHINHGQHFTSHHRIYSGKRVVAEHPYWGPASSWWDVEREVEHEAT